jgi:TolB-like protein/Tfp pilus assembly protein PilF
MAAAERNDEMLELHTLGNVDLRTSAGSAAPVRRLLVQPKAFALLVYLAAHESYLRRDLVAAMFWPDFDETHARNSLSKTLGRVADAVGRGVIETRGAWEIGVPPANVWCDARELERAAAARSDPAALDLFRGEFLDGWHLPGLSEFSHWVESTRLRLRQLAVQAARRVGADRAATGDLEHAVEVLRRARALAPADDVVTRELMAVLDRQGEGAAALEVFAEASAWLAREIGAGPAAATRVLADAIRGRAESTTAAVPSPVAADRTAIAPDGPDRIASLAVLPLVDLTGESDQRYFADGIADALITQLARLDAVRVISRQSTLRYLGSQLLVADIARELGVDALVEGSVTRSNDRVRVTIQLVLAEPERHLWAGAYERPVRDVLRLQSELTHAIAQEVARAAGRASPERSAIPDPPRVKPAAYEAYLKGRFFSAMLPDIPKAIACFHQAAALDPGYVPAWAGLAMAYANLALFVYLPPADALPEIARAASTALALDPRAGEAHMARGLSKLLDDWDWPGAAHDLDRAVSLAPGAVEPRAYRALLLSAMGDHDRALEDARCAATLDPLGPGTRFTMALCHYKARRHDESVRALDELLELYPHFALALPLLAANHAIAGRTHEAGQSARRCLTHLPDDQHAMAYAAAALGLAGERAEAQQTLDRILRLERSTYVDPWAIAVACCGLGDVDEALTWLRRLRERRSPSAFCVKTEPMFAPLHAHPEYRAILERLAFPA